MIDSVRLTVEINKTVNGMVIYGTINVKDKQVDNGELFIDVVPDKAEEPYLRIGEVRMRTVAPAAEGLRYPMSVSRQTTMSSEPQLIYTINELKNGTISTTLAEALAIVAAVNEEVSTTGTVTVK